MNKAKLVVLDDEENLANFVCKVAENIGFDTQSYNNAQAFQAQYDKNIDLIILDLMMPDVDGVEVIRFLAKTQCDAHLILMSGFDSGVLHSAKKLAKEYGLNLVGSLSKPFRSAELIQLLESLRITPRSRIIQNPIESITVDELDKAISNDELVVYYQPKIDLNNERIPAFEALVRWQHPKYGLIYPDAFILIAEQNGLIDRLTWVVLHQAMYRCQQWAEQGLVLQIAVNLSAQTLKNIDMPEKMSDFVEQYNISASQIILEITESALMQELITSLDVLTRLRMKGFHLSIDDFGTGFSSLVQLYRAPFSEIKVDQSFVFEMENDPEAATIVEMIIMMGKKLKMKTVAEGVESKYCKNKLAALGCDQAQGYLFSKPMPGNEVFDWVAENTQSA